MDLDRRPARPGGRVLCAGDLRPGRLEDALRRHPDGVPDEDCRARQMTIWPRRTGICNEWTGTSPRPCGDWAELGPTPLTNAAWGSRAGGNMAAVERTTADTSTGWAATTTGRVFISKNVDADPASAVSWTRLDDDSTATPGRFVSSIYVDPANGNHAWISYSGFNANTPATPGHVFEVTYNQATGTSTWVDRSIRHARHSGHRPRPRRRDRRPLRSERLRRPAARSRHESWVEAASGMPNVEVAGLTVSAERVLYAATHGLGGWRLNLG